MLVFIADGLLLYFFSGVTNVDWNSPASAALVFAVMLAAMVTGISFAFFRLAGDRPPRHRSSYLEEPGDAGGGRGIQCGVA